jgi:subtilisin family serine protease
MRRYIGLFGIGAIVLLAGLGAQPDTALSETKRDTDNADFAPDRILVKTKEGASVGTIEATNRKNKARTKKKIPRTRVSVVGLPGDLPVEEAVKRYENSPDVEYAEPDYKVYPGQSSPAPNDPRYPELYDLENTGQKGGTVDADIDAPDAWSSTTGEAGTVVAVIDRGVDTNHPDLKNNIWTNEDEVADNGVDDDRNGYVDDVNGWDFYSNDNSVYDSTTDDWHGTHVSGTIAAEGNNSTGVVGVNWRAKIMPLKFVGPGGVGYTSDAIEALNYAVANGAPISNNSWSKPYFSRSLFDAVKAADTKGHLFVASAGNNAEDNELVDHYPSDYDLPNIIAVSATDNTDSLASFSNYGAISVDLAAPGVHVLSTVPNNSYGFGSGTSMAAPHVAGAAALVKARFPSLDHYGIKDRILSSVDHKPDLAGRTATGGRLNVAKAVGANTTPVVDDTRPGRTRDRTPTISATVRDDETDLTASNISLYVDGRQVATFDYDQATDELTYMSTRLSSTRHMVEVIVQDGQGASTTKAWSFRVKRR